MKKQKKDIICVNEILKIEEFCIENDIDFEWINERQVRLRYNGVVADVFPLGKKYHNITTQQRGQYKDILGYVMLTMI